MLQYISIGSLNPSINVNASMYLRMQASNIRLCTLRTRRPQVCAEGKGPPKGFSLDGLGWTLPHQWQHPAASECTSPHTPPPAPHSWVPPAIKRSKHQTKNMKLRIFFSKQSRNTSYLDNIRLGRL